jgi:hypothetical protein
LVITGVVITFYLPMVAMGMFLLILLGLFLAQKYAQHLEHKSQVACPTCTVANRFMLLLSLAPPVATQILTRCKSTGLDNQRQISP